MNDLFQIEQDADVVKSNRADGAIIKAYEEGVGPGPTAPYAPDWTHITGPWNYAIFEIFMEAYIQKYVVTEEEQQIDIRDMFLARLRRLKKKVKQTSRRDGETYAQVTERLLRKHREQLENQRRNSRRNEVRRVLALEDHG